MSEQIKQDLPVLQFNSQSSFETWLADHHAESKGIWLKLAKKGSGAVSITYPQAVESAICYGWIDSQISHLDDRFYLQKFSPRRAKSVWSRTNREKAEELIASGRMHPAGYREVERAKADGRWDSAYDAQSQITIPDDLQAELDRNPQAKDFFATLNSLNRYAILHRIQVARRPKTRLARINKFVSMLANHEKIYP